jgi:hypothetical protein
MRLQLEKNLSEKPDQFLKKIEIMTSYSSNVENLDISIWSILMVVSFVNVSYFIAFFFMNISNAKVLDSINSFIRTTFDYFSGGNNKVIESFLFKFGDFQLMFEARLNNTYAITYRISLDHIFSAFQDYLA